MLELLLAPIDPSRGHEVGAALSWHGRFMVLGWGILAPVAVLIARFFKIMPGQDWPRVLDNQTWWRTHWIGQSIVVILSVCALLLVLPLDFGEASRHRVLGLTVLGLAVLQVVLGLCRGTKGGPTAPHPNGSLSGHHYDMSLWRRIFEALHKTIGYSTLAIAALAILTGMWDANAPLWMWCAVAIWWPCLIIAFIVMQRRGMAVDTYQAIWGDDPDLPGNQGPKPGWGVRRPGET